MRNFSGLSRDPVTRIVSGLNPPDTIPFSWRAWRALPAPRMSSAPTPGGKLPFRAINVRSERLSTSSVTR
jgi:hypothetical protein